MPTALPPAADFTGATVTEGQFKTALTSLRTFLAELLGADGSVATALGTLGAATPAEMQGYVAEVDADRVAAQAAAVAAQAAWTAALAANPDLNPFGRMNPSTLSADVTLAAGYNAVSAGPLTIGEGVEVTLADTSNWTIV
jgi:hypothetical protein